MTVILSLDTIVFGVLFLLWLPLVAVANRPVYMAGATFPGTAHFRVFGLPRGHSM